MKRYLIPVIVILFASCIQQWSGIRTISGTLIGAVPATAKIAMFPPDGENYFAYDSFSGEKDTITQYGPIGTGVLSASYTPVAGTVVTADVVDNTFTLLLPADPATVKFLIAWDDLNGNDIYDTATEQGYLAVKTINGKQYAVHHLWYIEYVKNITYEAIYSRFTDPDIAGFNTLHNDNFDAIGPGGFNFTFD